MGFDFYTRRMRRAAFHLVSMWFILIIGRLNCKTPTNPRPNIVVILIDDLDYVLAGLVSLFFLFFFFSETDYNVLFYSQTGRRGGYYVVLLECVSPNAIIYSGTLCSISHCISFLFFSLPYPILLHNMSTLIDCHFFFFFFQC